MNESTFEQSELQVEIPTPFSDGNIIENNLLRPLVEAVEGACGFAEAIRESGSASGSGDSRSRNFTTGADLAVEMFLGTSLRALDPFAGFVSEDKPVESANGCWWVVDPIDGTGNYMAGLSFATSVAYMDGDGNILAGAVCCPSEQVTYYAARGIGSYVRNYKSGFPEAVEDKNELKRIARIRRKHRAEGFECPCGGQQLHVDDYDDAERAANRYHLDAGGFGNLLFGMPQNPSKIVRQLGNIACLAPLFSDIKRIGPTSLDICKVSSSDALAYVGIEPEPWDVAAASVILEEAGGYVAGTLFGEGASDVYVCGSDGICERACSLLGLQFKPESETGADEETSD